MNQTAEGIRTFIALDLTQETKNALKEIQRLLDKQTGQKRVRWVKAPAFHLTLFFLGNKVVAEKIAAVSHLLDITSQITAPFDLTLGELGCFPHPRRPKILWVGTGGETSPLFDLKKRVDEGLANLGWQPEKRPYTPHLTIGRVKAPLGVANHDLPYGQILARASWRVDQIHLIHSRLTPQGAQYTKIHSAPFGQTNMTLT